MPRHPLSRALSALRSCPRRPSLRLAPAPYPEPVALPDGTAIFVRPVRSDDKRRIAALTVALSEESRFRRYLAPKGPLSRAELEYLTEIDHRDHEALVALDDPAGDAIGVARYIRDPADPRSAETAVVVHDRWQNQGVGSALLDRLAARAAANGVRRFTGTMLSYNTGSLRVLRHLGPTRALPNGAGTTAVEVDLTRDAR
jgi:GNAT superfamily N-acetyltransferase